MRRGPLRRCARGPVEEPVAAVLQRRLRQPHQRRRLPGPPGGPVRPAVRYCATPAGRVAYARVDTGPALLLDTGWVTHLTGQLELFSFGAFTERLAERFTVIRYDKPGCGLSDTDGADLSFAGQVAAAVGVAQARRSG